MTTGGTGLTPRDVTPQATPAVLDYEVPGLAEAMRAAGRADTPLADLSRGVVGVRGRTLIVNLPGQPEGRARIARGDRARAGSRPRDARGTVRPGHREPTAPSRRADPTDELRPLMFPPFADVPAYPLVFLVFWGAAAFFVLAMARHLRVFARRPAVASPFANIPARVVGLVRVRLRPDEDVQGPAAPAIMHAGIFWGFVLLTIGTANIVTGGIIQAVLSIPFDGAPVGARSARCRTSSR